MCVKFPPRNFNSDPLHPTSSYTYEVTIAPTSKVHGGS